jgi:protein-L-isoaspartate(D-aspartate) O-methyltransferase
MLAAEENRFARLREAMVKEQISAKGIRDPRVLDAMRRTPREKFLPPGELPEAYADTPLPIDCGQTVSQPYMVALMTECLQLQGGERTLEIGTGSGYQTAILCSLCDFVYSVEKYPELSGKAAAILQELGCSNSLLTVGDGTKGWPEYAPYDAIIVTAGAPDVPAPLMEQLAVGGRLVIPVGDAYSQVLRKIVRTDAGYTSENVCGCRFVPLVGEYGWPE